MHHIEKKRNYLKAKGWTDEEIEKTIAILKHAEEHKHKGIFLLDKLVYWIILVFTVIVIALFSHYIIPLLIAIPSSSFYIIIALIALIFGFLFAFLIREIDTLNHKHHIIVFLLIPLFALLNFIVMINKTREMVAQSRFIVEHNPFAISITFIIFFLLPYLYFLLVHKKNW